MLNKIEIDTFRAPGSALVYVNRQAIAETDASTAQGLADAVAAATAAARTARALGHDVVTVTTDHEIADNNPEFTLIDSVVVIR